MHERWVILAVLTFARTAMGFQFQSVAAVSPLLWFSGAMLILTGLVLLQFRLLQARPERRAAP